METVQPVETLDGNTNHDRPDRIRDLVRGLLSETMDRLNRQHPETHRQYERAAERYLTWAVENGYEPDTDTVFSPERVERYTHSRFRDECSARTIRSVLRVIGREVSPKAAWVAPPPQYPRSPLPAPYEASEMARLDAIIRSQPTAVRRHVASAASTLVSAFGIHGSELAEVTRESFCDWGGYITLTVQGRTEPIICLSSWEEEVKQLIERAPSGRLVTRNQLNNHVHKFVDPADPSLRFVLGRFRTTWLVAHLQAGTPLDVLLPQAGLETGNRLFELFEYLPKKSVTEKVTAMKGDFR